MYSNHVPIINGAMRQYQDVFRNGVLFAILSARMPFLRTLEQCEDVRKQGAKSSSLWGFKFDTFTYLSEPGNLIPAWRAVTNAVDPVSAMLAVTRIPGVGINKGGFICQMLGHDIACLDTRNNRRLGIHARKYTSHHKDGARWPKLIADYVGETMGKAESLWNMWCEDVAKDNDVEAEYISRAHVDAIVPRAQQSCWRDPVPAQDIPF